MNIYVNSANAYFGLGQLDRAIKDYSRAIELNPSDVRALGYRGSTYMQLGKLVEAKADFEQALKLKPDDKYASAGLKRLIKRKPGKN